MRYRQAGKAPGRPLPLALAPSRNDPGKPGDAIAIHLRAHDPDSRRRQRGVRRGRLNRTSTVRVRARWGKLIRGSSTGTAPGDDMEAEAVGGPKARRESRSTRARGSRGASGHRRTPYQWGKGWGSGADWGSPAAGRRRWRRSPGALEGRSRCWGPTGMGVVRRRCLDLGHFLAQVGLAYRMWTLAGRRHQAPATCRGAGAWLPAAVSLQPGILVRKQKPLFG